MVETLRPVVVSDFYIQQIANGVKRYFKENIFDEIFKILNDNTVINSKEDIIQAINSGRIYYSNGAFRAEQKFSNAVATSLEQMGAKFKYGVYYIERNLIPFEIENILSIVATREAAKTAALSQLLVNLPGILDKLTLNAFIEKAVEKTFNKLEEDITKAAEEKKIPVITFEPTDKQSQKIAQDYTHNMQYWVKKWETKEIIKMREDVARMVAEGARTPTLKKYFQKRWGIAERKAEFLAINESHLAGSVIQATRHQGMGFTHFKWGRSSSKEKRKLHEEYYNKIFAYDDPPIIDEKLRFKGLPRQIWNCKCHIMPVINSSFFENAHRIKNAKRNIFTKAWYTITNSKQRNNNPWRYRRFGEGEAV